MSHHVLGRLLHTGVRPQLVPSRAMSGLFTGTQHAAQYKKYRPTYPPEVYSAIVDFCKTGSYQHALDLGCGSGQSTLPLLQNFTRVTGIDPSESQIAQAWKSLDGDPESYKGLEFVSGTAEDLSNFASGSVDLITCAQSLHWVDIDLFYPEVNRVLRDGGALVAYGYGNVKVDSTAGNDIIWDFYSSTLGSYWDSRRGHIDNHLAGFSFPLSDVHRLDNHVISRDMSLADFLGYINSWSAYQTYRRQHPDSDILGELEAKLCGVYGGDKPDSVRVAATWPIFMLFGRKS